LIKRNHASEGTNDTYDNTGGVANLALTLFVSTVKSGGHKYPSPAEAGEGKTNETGQVAYLPTLYSDPALRLHFEPGKGVLWNDLSRYTQRQ
jgi:hypothetical protein